MDESGHRAPSSVPRPGSTEEATAWRFLDAVWDVPIGLGLCDAGLRFVRVNDALADFDGLPVAAHFEKDTLRKLPPEFSEGLRRASAGFAHGTGDSQDVEFGSSGRRVLAKLHSVLRPNEREPIGVSIVALDVTDERKALQDLEVANHLFADLLAAATARELSLSRLIESMQEGVLLVDSAGRMKQVNRAAERILGHRRDALVGARFEDERWWSADGTGKRDALALFARALEQSALFHCELHVETEQGRAFLAADATALRDARGRVEDVVVSLRDVTAERHALDAARADLEFQQQIIGIVGHDLRNPLTTITGSISMMRRQAGLTPSSVASLDRAARSADRMARLISDLLDFARTRAPGGLPVVPAQADFHAICKGSVEECRAASSSSTIELETSGDGAGCWDADRIEQALTNLIINAIQHGARNPIHVHSNGSLADIVEVKVHNAGAVIPAEALPELFRAYRRGVRSEPAGRRSGLGLGLYIVAQIAAAHGGTASAESSAAAGTTFTIRLPRAFPKKGP